MILIHLHQVEFNILFLEASEDVTQLIIAKFSCQIRKQNNSLAAKPALPSESRILQIFDKMIFSQNSPARLE